MPTPLDAFNARTPAEAEAELLACCHSRAFAAEVAARRPFPDLDGLSAAAVAAVRGLEWPDVLEALAAHPRIGERAGGTGRAAEWSRQEQSGVTDGLRAELAERNRAYEARFGHVYLICATGLTGGQLLARLRERLGNDEETERGVVRHELAEITRLRIAKSMGEEAR
ncbi:2-oxo-4-hydroxy-4-carboxy-5-ureidoimidazoline decarboxylase [Nonomuraea jiangxiensis]|uniref:2-oxo-4-hydroxy-4-carboxy-5-ureidoimidazoline decarboxylase n=1 Tax=Nonomuraea jiangxiensis TaxID=633440 RepID=A0A1G8H702_9ACTN|nr:2-oxo-4-hydroxy-4-carboxy-5-ureidoimidazoline decarboxylase [Nonomuraea jiangxiensis]SDI02437.1 2-oxo-4-hydroxy-4-carboxy-5-ureidoimidazoline decarboxylase [Nonomuraea jiangxiensis]